MNDISIKGFTLLELTVIISVIIILMTFTLANYRGGEKEFSLLRSIHRLAQDLRTAQEMAMAGERFDNVFPKGGYGLYFVEDSNSYILFADCNGNFQYDGGDNPSIGCASSTESTGGIYPEAVKTLTLEEKIKISNLFPASPLNITFFHPDPTVTIKPQANSATIRLTLNGQTRSITINSAGLIEIK